MKNFPTKLDRHDLFPCPLWITKDTQFVKELNKFSEPFIQEAKKLFKPMIDERNKKYGNKKDMGYVFHSKTLMQDKNFIPFHQYITLTARNLLVEMGYNLSDFDITLTESWVQEFAKTGAGHHTLHNHWNGHISGFYFLKASNVTSRPVFQDPRPGALMTGLPLKNGNQVTYGSPEINYNVEPGTMIFFPSYMPHMFSVDMGYEPFRFIHWNIQAIPTPSKIGL